MGRVKRVGLSLVCVPCDGNVHFTVRFKTRAPMLGSFHKAMGSKRTCLVLHGRRQSSARCVAKTLPYQIGCSDRFPVGVLQRPCFAHETWLSVLQRCLSAPFSGHLCCAELGPKFPRACQVLERCPSVGVPKLELATPGTELKRLRRSQPLHLFTLNSGPVLEASCFISTT